MASLSTMIQKVIALGSPNGLIHLIPVDLFLWIVLQQFKLHPTTPFSYICDSIFVSALIPLSCFLLSPSWTPFQCGFPQGSILDFPHFVFYRAFSG